VQFLIICFIYICSFTNICLSDGLIAPSELIIKDVIVGKKNKLSELTNRLFRVSSTDENSVDVRLYVEIPNSDEIKDGCEPLPNISWIEIEKTTFTLTSYGIGETEVYIRIPSNKKYRNKRYQLYIISETVPKGPGLVCGIALKTRIIFETIYKPKYRKLSK